LSPVPLSILALVHRVPYPPNKGEKIRAYHELSHLAARGHTIDLATFADVEEDRAYGPELSRICRQVKIVPKDKRLGRVRSLAALPAGRPLSVGYFHSYRLRSTVRRWAAANAYDVVFCYSSPMAEYAQNGALRQPRVARIMDFVDVDSDKWRQYAERTEEPMRSIYRLEARLLAAYERRIAEQFDASTLVSPAECETFKKLAPRAKAVLSIPNGVDAEYFGATVRRPSRPPILVFVGQMDYFANVDGVSWFAKEVLPSVRARIPGARFQIVGRAPTPEVSLLGELAGVEVIGGVPDIRDYLGSATLMVAPLRIARGIQNKVLEGMAARLPVVASPAAFEGIEGQDGVHAVVGADAPSYADAVVSLLEDPARQTQIAAAARALVESRYAWGPAMDKLEGLMERLVEAKRGP
jgi:sugar transferase (PEP-CTERM/EpsH1 system associated)